MVEGSQRLYVKKKMMQLFVDQECKPTEIMMSTRMLLDFEEQDVDGAKIVQEKIAANVRIVRT